MLSRSSVWGSRGPLPHTLPPRSERISGLVKRRRAGALVPCPVGKAGGDAPALPSIGAAPPRLGARDRRLFPPTDEAARQGLAERLDLLRRDLDAADEELFQA